MSRPDLDGQDLYEGLARIEHFIRAEQYRGFDPYDGLMSLRLKKMHLTGNRVTRVAIQQMIRRFPVNARALLKIRKGYNPVTLALCLDAYLLLLDLFPEKAETYRKEIAFCVEELLRLRSVGYSGSCWGYDFDWEARHASLPAHTPTVVATGLVVNSLVHLYRHSSDAEVLEVCKGASDFVRGDLHRTNDADSFCFSYSPCDEQCVLNASMFGARLLAQVSSMTGDEKLLDDARRAVRFVILRQQTDGSWPYAVNENRNWIDNFHTGYILECLNDYLTVARDPVAAAGLEKGYQLYKHAFLSPGGLPKYYHDALYPIDSTAAAQCIITLTKLGDPTPARKIASWMIRNMQDPGGSFYYRRYRFFVNRISYMRWSNAWMFMALAYFCTQESNREHRTEREKIGEVLDSKEHAG